jgi:methyl-accepting chemotaxis protein
MDRLAKGDLAVRIPHAERVNEIGDMSRATIIFRDGLVETAKLREAEAKRGAELEAARRAAIQEIASSLRSAASSVGALEGSIGRVSDMTQNAGQAIGTINHATKSLADEAVQLRGATQSLIQRLEAA